MRSEEKNPMALDLDSIAPSLRDRIAQAIHGRPLDGTEHPDDAECVRRCADDVLAVLADADPTDIGGRTLTKIQMLEQERDAMQRRTFELAERIEAARAEVPAVLDLLRAVVERCVPAVLDAQARPIDDLWGRVWHRLGNAHPRTEEAHTVDVGHVHVLAEPGGPCAPGCPHPDHHTTEP